MVVPHLGKYLDAKDLILACRPVSKAWKDGVDQFLQARVQQWNPHFHDDASLPVVVGEHLGEANDGLSYSGRNVFSRMEQLDRFQQDMAAADHQGRNPFPSRSIVYQSSPFDDEDMDGFEEVNERERLLAFLTTFGSHVADFTYSRENWVFGVRFDHLARFLRRLPNLTSFSLQDFSHAGPLEQHSPEYDELFTTPQQLAELRHLKSLKFHVAPLYGAVVKLVDRLLAAYGSQLEQLEIDSDAFFSTDYLGGDESLTQDSGKLMQIRNLKIRNIWGGWAWSGTKEKLLKIQLPQLQRVSLHFLVPEDKGKIQLRDLMELLNHWSSSSSSPLSEAHLLVDLHQLLMYSPFSSKQDAAEGQTMMDKQLPSMRVLGICFSLLKTHELSWVLHKFPDLERLEFHNYHHVDSFRGGSPVPVSEESDESGSEVDKSGSEDENSELDDDADAESDLKCQSTPFADWDSSDEEESSAEHPTDEMAASSGLQSNESKMCQSVKWLWEAVPTLKEIIVWKRSMLGNAPARVLYWEKGGAKSCCLRMDG